MKKTTNTKIVVFLRLCSLVLLISVFCDTSLFAQSRITGKVIDSKGETLPGVSILEEGTNNGTITDVNGEFALLVTSSNTRLTFSYVGFESQTVSVGNSTVLDIQMKEDIASLEEVVVIGYGTAKKSDLTGAVASLGSEGITEMNKVDLASALQGRVAGVSVRTLNSKPGAGLSIKIRGNTVIQNNNLGRDGLNDDPARDLSRPLYVIDGIFLDDISALNPNDIEKIDILKDASATAIYGSRGANGVVIISTKTGFEGKTSISYEATVGFSRAGNIPDMRSGENYVQTVDDYARHLQWIGETDFTRDNFYGYNIDRSIALTTEEQQNVANNTYTDWMGNFQKTGIQTSHNLSLAGGQNGLTYTAAIGYLKDEGVIGIEGFDRYNIRSSVTKTFNNVITAGVNAYAVYSVREEGSRELFRSSFRLPPTTSAFDENGDILFIPDGNDQRFINPIYEDEGAWTVNTKKLQFFGNAFVEIKPVKWLSVKSTIAPSLNVTRFGEYRGLNTKSSRGEPGRIRSYYDNFFDRSYTWDNVLNINKEVVSGHNLNLSLISSLWNIVGESGMIQTRNFAYDGFGFFSTQNGSDVRTFASNYTEQTLLAYAARLNYNINDKYLITVTGRYDGSSKLAPGNKWSFFPSAAVAWRMSNEAFMQDIDFISNLKLRASYGESGNDAPLSPYQSASALTNRSYVLNNAIVQGNAIEQLSNQDLTWERSKEFNFGVDFGLFNSRISGSLEIYNKRTEDAIINRDLMAVTGFSGGAVGNFGSVRNSGIELSLNSFNVATANFEWETSLNFARNKNEILELDGDAEQFAAPGGGGYNLLRVGRPIDGIYFYANDGIWQLDEADEAAIYNAVPGQYKLIDQNSDGLINQDDIVYLGNNAPDWIGGITNTFRYKNFDFSVMIYTQQGIFGHSEFYQHFMPYGDNVRFNSLAINYWTPDNTGSEYPLPGNYQRATDVTPLVDMSFVRVGNIGFGYSIPHTILDKLNVQSASLTLDIQNPFTFTDFLGPDPETGLQNSYNMAYMRTTTLLGLRVTL